MAINRLGMLQYPCAQGSAECAFAHRDHSIRVIVIICTRRCAALSAAISLVLRLLGKALDPSKSREPVLFSVLAERRMQQGHTAELGSLLDEVLQPPVDRIGALDVDDFRPEHERRGLAAALNTLLASPTFTTTSTASCTEATSSSSATSST